MRAQLKEFYSLDFDLNSYWPDESDNFGFWVRAMIGPEGEEGAESFDMQICTPEWLKSKHSDNEVVFGSHMLIVFEYDLDRIKNKVSSYCNSCSGKTWQEIAEKLSRIGYWEFEDYTE
ncbi:immunity 8 family protein [Shewanella sp. SM23]|uniref:immunity 8 family protein n=1 Tax=Shewanella sp. SM23 TaxID=2912794 RepID=UPI0021DB483D|nr:immunity 8 family protein [Shewanella sp. SM23]MCU8085410.1 immunity 8 family protein [Shewanella sp. SM23]